MADTPAHASTMEPLAALLTEAMDAAGLKPADVARMTGLSSQLLSQILNRKRPYGERPPKIETMQALGEKVPGLSVQLVAQAVAQSMGWPSPVADSAKTSALRRSVHAVVDKIPERRLGEALQHLTVLLGGLKGQD